jgi:signal transduction histidine kinase
MTRRLLASYLTITAFVLLILEVPLAITYERSERERVNAALERDANTIGAYSQSALQSPRSNDVHTALLDLLHRVAHNTNEHITVVDKNGISIADSDNNASRVDYSKDTEIREVLDLDHPTNPTAPPAVHLERFSKRTNADMLFVAVPVVLQRTLLGAVNMSYSVSFLNDRVHRNWLSLAFLAVVVLAAVAIVGSLFARSVTTPVRQLELAVAAVARGDLTARAPDNDGPPEVRRLAAEFNDMARRLSALIGAQRAFVADASHELRTPLTALRLRIENLAFAAPEEIPAEIDELSEEIGRLNRVVDGLLALARAEGRRPDREMVDVPAEVRARVDAWQPLAEEQDVSVVCDANGHASAQVVRGALAQILDNYLANALEVAPVGSTIAVHVERNGSHVAVHVVDQGPGMAAEDRARAFDRFWRSSTATPGRGSGLGLAIVRQLAEASGGSAALEAAPGGGTDALVVLPTA